MKNDENDDFKCIFKKIKTFKIDLIDFYIDLIDFYIVSMLLLISFILLSLFMLA